MFSQKMNKDLYIAHNEFVRCVVPKERLLEICMTCGNVTYQEIGEFINRIPEEYGRYSNDYVKNYHPKIWKKEQVYFLHNVNPNWGTNWTKEMQPFDCFEYEKKVKRNLHCKLSVKEV